MKSTEVLFPCHDCGMETRQHEYYMVQDALWKAAGAPLESFLCIGCLEVRLGRQLNSSDFTKCPLNQDLESGVWVKSERLKDRLSTPVTYGSPLGDYVKTYARPRFSD